MDFGLISKIIWLAIEEADHIQSLPTNEERVAYIAGRVKDPADEAIPLPIYLEPFDGLVIEQILTHVILPPLVAEWPEG